MMPLKVKAKVERKLDKLWDEYVSGKVQIIKRDDGRILITTTENEVIETE